MLIRRSHRSRKSASRKHRRTHGQFSHQRKALFEQLEDRRLLAVYTSGDVPQAIPDQGTMVSTLEVADSVTIGDLNVTLDINHTRDKDLDVVLVGPDGTRVELMTDVGGSGNNFEGTFLDDEAASSITLGSAPFAGSYQPEGSLSSLDGKSAQGTWTLEVTDDRHATDDLRVGLRTPTSRFQYDDSSPVDRSAFGYFGGGPTRVGGIGLPA